MDILDLRDLVKEYDDLIEKLESEDFDHDDQIKLRELRNLESNLDTSLQDAANDGCSLIPESEWQNYCQEIASDLYTTKDSQKNPLMNHIDWASWADEMSHDYTMVTFEGCLYYYSDHL